MNREYQECVEEIKRENKILGSLGFHHETMRRLKQKQSAKVIQDDGMQSTPKIIRSFDMRCEPKSVRSFARSLMMNDIARSLHDMSRRVSAHRSSSAGSTDPSTEVIPGRRQSAVDMGFDLNIISAQMLQDLELSDDSECEDENSSQPSDKPMGENGSGGRHASLIRRRSSRMGANGSGGRRPSIIRMTSSKIKMPNAIRRYSTRRPSTPSVSFGTKSSPNANKEGDGILAPEERKSNGEEGSRRGSMRIGKRRSSLFFVDDQRASITNGFGRSSTTSLSDESLKDCVSGVRDGSLICSFRHRNSLNSSFGSIGDDSLICGW
jgi:hypothetical protein